MKTYKFTLIHKQYYDQEIEANSYQEASERFNEMICEDELPWDNPDYMDSEQYFEEITQ
jgi:hypothetical protein